MPNIWNTMNCAQREVLIVKVTQFSGYHKLMLQQQLLDVMR